MSWGTVEEEPEVHKWLEELSDQDFGHVAFYIELLADNGPKLDEPHTRQLEGKVRELRFHMGTEQHRISYWIASGRRIILLTHFRKTRTRERRQIRRALDAYDRCVDERHDTEDD